MGNSRGQLTDLDVPSHPRAQLGAYPPVNPAGPQPTPCPGLQHMPSPPGSLPTPAPAVPVCWQIFSLKTLSFIDTPRGWGQYHLPAARMSVLPWPQFSVKDVLGMNWKLGCRYARATWLPRVQPFGVLTWSMGHAIPHPPLPALCRLTQEVAQPGGGKAKPSTACSLLGPKPLPGPHRLVGFLLPPAPPFTSCQLFWLFL